MKTIDPQPVDLPASLLSRLPLTTERLTLRKLTEADIPALFQIYGDPEAMRYWSSPPMTDLAEAADLLQRTQEGYAQGTSWRLGVARRETGDLIGICSLFHWHPECRRMEIGYILARPYWGSGYMTEALTTLIDFAFSSLGLHRLEADIDPRNGASARVLERLGFQKEGHLRERWIVGGEVSDTALYGLLASDWANNHAQLPSIGA